MTDETTIGKLKEPIEIRLIHPTIAHGPDAPKTAAEVRARELVRAYGGTLEKLELLFKHYGLARTGNDAADYRALVLRIAPERFRGFEVVDINARRPYEHRRGNWVTGCDPK
jgi:hypothetical protein